MGNILICMYAKHEQGGNAGSRSKRGARSHPKTPSEEELLHRKAMAIAIHQHQSSQRFEGSMSRRIGSVSSRRRELPESVSNGKQVPVFLDNLETKKIVLVHGEGFGAWCWYKIISLLEEVGLQPVALNLTSCGTDHTDVNSIRTLAEYTKPLIDFLYNLPEDEKVILVGHSVGAASISLALESYPKKITKAVFICATMIRDGHRPIDVFTEELASADVFLKESKLLMYGNGKDKSPTSIMFDKEQTKGLYFNQSPSKDVALSALSMRPIPLVQIMEKLSLTEENYGSVRRFYVQTLDDQLLSLDTQEKIVRENPPDGVYKIKGSDHCPFFSKPLSLNKILLEIAQLP